MTNIILVNLTTTATPGYAVTAMQQLTVHRQHNLHCGLLVTKYTSPQILKVFQERDYPIFQVGAIPNKWANHVPLECSRLHALGLTQFEKVIVFDADTSFKGSVAPLFDVPDFGYLFGWQYGVLAGGTFVCSPNVEDYRDVIELMFENNFSYTMGWNNYGLFDHRGHTSWNWSGAPVSEGILFYHYVITGRANQVNAQWVKAGGCFENPIDRSLTVDQVIKQLRMI